MPDGSIKVEGARELRKKLRNLDDDLSDLKDVHKAAGTIVLKEAKILVPVDSGALLGTLRLQATKTKAGIRAGLKSVPYAGPLHFGHNPRGQGGYMTPQPFLYDALDARRAEVIDKYEAGITAAKRKAKL